ncbi:MAG: hypothetical protein ACI9FN_003006 [Saprospiraceae bacterium]|jgi:hypothetical protein
MTPSTFFYTILFSILFYPNTVLVEANYLDSLKMESTEDDETLFSYLNKQEEVTIHVSESLRSILKDFKNDTITNGSIEFVTGDKTYSYSSKIECGGKTRRKICRTPPLKLNFKKKALKKDKFNKSCDKMKIVFQCENSGKMANSILSEMLIYDLYRIVSPFGFRAFKAKVKIGTDKKHLQTLVLEDEDDLMYRTATAVLKNRTIGTNVMERNYYVRMCLFQYMIGNTDWSARKGHNTKLFRRLEDNALIIIPYDFDYSGIINNDYAVPSEKIRIENVRTRHFMDKTIGRDELDPAIADFIKWESDIFGSVTNAEYLSNSTRNSMSNYIKDFYKIIKDEKKIKRMLKK